MTSLSDIGWDDGFARSFAALGAESLLAGRVILEHTHIYRVFMERGEILARVSGRMRHQATTRPDYPAVGDWVAVDPASDGDARIHAILPRRSRFSRHVAGHATEEQIVAANIDTVFLVAGLDGDFNPRRIERYLVVATASGAVPVIVLNKADLTADPEARAAEVRQVAPRVPVHIVSCNVLATLDALRQYLGPGQTGALLGSSGVGKSTIVNRLIGQELLRTRDVRVSDSKGRHTSTARQLVLLPGAGVLIDTPGMREIQLWEAGKASSAAFADIDALGARCRFRDCCHRHEPGCAVRAAADAGELPAGRLESYQKLQDEQARQATQLDQRAQIDEKRRVKSATKALEKRLRERR